MGVLDEFRDIPERAGWQLGERPAWQKPVPATGPTLASVVAAGGRATTRPTRRTRAFLWTMLSVATVVAVLSPLLRTALATGTTGTDLFALAAAALSWPTPFVQPAVLATAAVTLLVLAIVTRGFTSVTTATVRLGTVAAVTGLVAAAPFALVILGFAVALALGVAIVIGIFALIIAALSN